MRVPILAVGLFAAFVLLLTDAGRAQTGDQSLGGRQNYAVQSMNFDLWCQETQRYAVDRCDERRAEDVREFESYRNIIERYELQYLQQQRRNAEAEQRADRYYGPPRDRYNDPLGRP